MMWSMTALASPGCGLSTTLVEAAQLAHQLELPVVALQLYRRGRSLCPDGTDVDEVGNWNHLDRAELLALSQRYLEEDSLLLSEAASSLADVRSGALPKTRLQRRLDVLGTSVDLERVRWVQECCLRSRDPIVYAFFSSAEPSSIEAVEALHDTLPHGTGLIALTASAPRVPRWFDDIPTGRVRTQDVHAHGLRTTGGVFIQEGLVQWIGSLEAMTEAARTESRPFQSDDR